MKTIGFIILSAILLTFGCASTREFLAGIDEDQAIIISSRITAREIGCETAFSENPEIDRALRNIYDLAASGELSQDAMDQLNDAISAHIGNRPTLVPNIIDLMELVGVHFNDQGQAIGLEDVSPKLFDAVAKGYVSGFDTCQHAIKAGLTQSDIIAMEKVRRRNLQR